MWEKKLPKNLLTYVHFYLDCGEEADRLWGVEGHLFIAIRGIAVSPQMALKASVAGKVG